MSEVPVNDEEMLSSASTATEEAEPTEVEHAKNAKKADPLSYVTCYYYFQLKCLTSWIGLRSKLR